MLPIAWGAPPSDIFILLPFAMLKFVTEVFCRHLHIIEKHIEFGRDGNVTPRYLLWLITDSYLSVNVTVGLLHSQSFTSNTYVHKKLKAWDWAFSCLIFYLENRLTQTDNCVQCQMLYPYSLKIVHCKCRHWKERMVNEGKRKERRLLKKVGLKLTLRNE